MAPIQVDIIERPDEAGADVLAFADSLAYFPAQHDPRWGAVYEGLEGERLTVAVARAGARVVGVSTFCLFAGPFGNILHANPYMGYGGCSCLPDRRDETIAALIRAQLDWARDNACITATIALPPFCEELEDVYLAAIQPDYRFENFYQYQELTDASFAELSRKRKRNIRAGEKAGVELSLAAEGSEVEAWLDVYEARYAEIGARPLPRAFLRAMWDVFAPVGTVELHLARLGGELLGGTLFLLGRGIVDYFSPAFCGEAMRHHPGEMLLHRALKRYLDAGFGWFNWQSCESRECGVYEYKRRWGAREGRHLILTRVLGDASVFTGRPLAEVREAYGQHFVLPYRLWEAP